MQNWIKTDMVICEGVTDSVTPSIGLTVTLTDRSRAVKKKVV